MKWLLCVPMLLLLSEIAEPGARTKDGFVLGSFGAREEVVDGDVRILALGFRGEVGRKNEEEVAMI